MCTRNKKLLRLAANIYDDVVRSRSNRRYFSLPVDSWQRCAELARRARRAELRDWQLAAKALLSDLRYSLASLQGELETVSQQLPGTNLLRILTTPHLLYTDLVALESEFGGIDYDLGHRRLRVTTEPIELAGVYLGPFEIQLNWSRQGSFGRPEYRINATDPHPPESRQDVTHPHVADGVLCEGEGKHAIGQALEQARLLDFFTLVSGVLRTYNAESPFVELELWRGTTCSDCGAVVSEGDGYACQSCGETLCGTCEISCARCEDSHCSQCVTTCAACEELVCRRCLKTCSGCGRRVCSGCLTHEERCSNCHENESEADFNSDASLAV
jgi:hypothetical protein